MKHTSFLISSLLILLSGTVHAAHFNRHHANSLATRNIGTMQHSITHTAMQMFSGTPTVTVRNDIAKPSPDEYGQMPIYGTAPMYGEYEAYEFYGRSGGDISNAIQNTWMSWNHFSDNVKYQSFDRIDSDQDLAMIAVSGGNLQSINNSRWGAFAGYLGGEQSTETIDLTNNGGFFGAYSELNLGGFRVTAMADLGMSQNEMEHDNLSDKFTNIWAGGAIDLSYGIALDKTFFLRPGIYAGYTWIQSKNYTSALGENIVNSDLNMFEIAPGITAIKHIDDGWFGTMFVRYVYQTTDGGETKIDNTPIPELEIDNFTEYGLSIKKSIEQFDMSATVGRHEGARDGWFGGLSLKHIF